MRVDSTRGSSRGRGGASAAERGPGRGGRRCGRRRRVAPNVDVSTCWKLESCRNQGDMMVRDFSHNLVQQRARMFCSTAVNNLCLVFNVRSLPLTRGGFIVLPINGLLVQPAEWLNERIFIESLEKGNILGMLPFYCSRMQLVSFYSMEYKICRSWGVFYLLFTVLGLFQTMVWHIRGFEETVNEDRTGIRSGIRI